MRSEQSSSIHQDLVSSLSKTAASSGGGSGGFSKQTYSYTERSSSGGGGTMGAGGAGFAAGGGSAMSGGSSMSMQSSSMSSSSSMGGGAMQMSGAGGGFGAGGQLQAQQVQQQHAMQGGMQGYQQTTTTTQQVVGGYSVLPFTHAFTMIPFQLRSSQLLFQFYYKFLHSFNNTLWCEIYTFRRLFYTLHLRFISLSAIICSELRYAILVTIYFVNYFVYSFTQILYHLALLLVDLVLEFKSFLH